MQLSSTWNIADTTFIAFYSVRLFDALPNILADSRRNRPRAYNTTLQEEVETTVVCNMFKASLFYPGVTVIYSSKSRSQSISCSDIYEPNHNMWHCLPTNRSCRSSTMYYHEKLHMINTVPCGTVVANFPRWVVRKNQVAQAGWDFKIM